VFSSLRYFFSSFFSFLSSTNRLCKRVLSASRKAGGPGKLLSLSMTTLPSKSDTRSLYFVWKIDGPLSLRFAFATVQMGSWSERARELESIRLGSGFTVPIPSHDHVPV
jgi:hypothetical protein